MLRRLRSREWVTDLILDGLAGLLCGFQQSSPIAREKEWKAQHLIRAFAADALPGRLR